MSWCSKNGGTGNAISSSSSTAMMGEEFLAWKVAPYRVLFALVFGCPLIFQLWLGLSWYLYPLSLLLFILPTFGVFMIVFNYLSTVSRNQRSSQIESFIEFKDESLKRTYFGKFIPMQVLYEAYADDKLVFRSDVLKSLEYRERYVAFRLMWWHVKFFVFTFLPELLRHSRKQDTDQVRDHYDRGNDFYQGFLGPVMIYTSGIKSRNDDSLEQMQVNKMKLVCEKIGLESGDKLLDIGCGWGTLVNFAVEQFNASGVGVTLAKNQVEWARAAAEQKNQGDRSKFLCLDYRDIPEGKKYDKITCLEMAEHVGVRHFGQFMTQVYNMLEDDGVFFLQIAGLRRAWQWEDFIWGLFMDRYIFPGADASCPLSFVIGHLEAAGFEVQSTETIGIHYSHTIHQWYLNWIKEENRDTMTARYGLRLYRIWEIFLAWSTIIARQGNSTCFQIVCHKNLNRFDRSQFIKGASLKNME